MKRFFEIFFDIVVTPRAIEREVETRYPNEPVLESVKLWRAFYTTEILDPANTAQTPIQNIYHFFDNNMFFQAWMIRTTRRILIARNSNQLRVFRDIPYEYISRVEFDEDDTHARIHITSGDKKDTLEFIQKRDTTYSLLHRRIVDAAPKH